MAVCTIEESFEIELKEIMKKLWFKTGQKRWNYPILIKNSSYPIKYKDAKQFIKSFSKIPFQSLKETEEVDIKSFILSFICQFDYQDRFNLSINLCYNQDNTASISVKADIALQININVLKTLISILVSCPEREVAVIEYPTDPNHISVLRIINGEEELFVGFDPLSFGISLLSSRTIPEKWYQIDFMFKCNDFEGLLIDIMKTCMISTLYHPNIELVLGLFQDYMLLRIPFCTNPMDWMDSLFFRSKLFSNFIFPGILPVHGIERYEIPELFGCADSCVVVSPSYQSNRLLLYVFQNGYPLKGLNNFTIGILNALQLPFTIMPLPIEESYNEERSNEWKPKEVIIEGNKKRRKAVPFPKTSSKVQRNFHDDYCIECRVPKMNHTSIIITVNSTRTDIVSFSAKAIEKAFEKCVEKRPNLRQSFHEIPSAKGIWKTIQSVQESVFAVLGKETVGNAVWNKCSKIINQKL